MEETKDFTTVRVHVDNRQDIEEMASRLFLMDGEKRSAGGAIKFAVDVTKVLLIEDPDQLQKIIARIQGKKKK
jgi:hypothetical protein